jgi:hypothetical protein
MPTRSPKTLAPLFATLLCVASAVPLDAAPAIRPAAIADTMHDVARDAPGWLDLLRQRLTAWLAPQSGETNATEPAQPATNPTQPDEGPEADPGG